VGRQQLPPDKPDDLSSLTDQNWVANAIGMLEPPEKEAKFHTAQGKGKKRWNGEGRCLTIAKV